MPAYNPTTRLGISHWPSGTDPVLRDHFETSFAALEAKVGVFLSGLLADRPAAGASNARALYLATDQTASGQAAGTLFYSNGTTWTALNQFAAPVAQTPGDAIAAGTAGTYARSDHKHSLPDWGVVGELAQIGTAAAAGTTAKFARVDHAHTLANGAVTAGKIAAGGVSATNQIADGIVTTAKLAAGAVDGTILSTDQKRQTGEIILYGGSVAPTGWLFCDGTSYATATYAALFAIIGYTFGGAGANFNVPDLRGRVPVGVGTGSGLTARARGATGGAESVALVTAELASHSHTVNSHSHGGVTGNNSVDHTHAVGSLVNSTESLNHRHAYSGTVVADNATHYHNITNQATSGETSPHYHLMGDGSTFAGYTTSGGPTAGYAGVAGSGTTLTGWGNTGYNVGDHAHTLTGNTDNANATHSHTYSGTTGIEDASHNHTISGSTAGQSVSHTHSVAAESPGTTSTGSGTAHNNMQPWLALNFLIKV